MRRKVGVALIERCGGGFVDIEIGDMSTAAAPAAYLVVRNIEEQYSIWPTDQPVPAGWLPVGDPAGRDDCLRVVERLWTDMRPASLRTRTDHHQRSGNPCD